MAVGTEVWSEERIEVAGLTLRSLVGGEGKPAVVLHHSTGNPGWLPFHDALAKSFRVYALDMPGWGQSQRADWARDARDIAILVNRALVRLDLQDVTLIGLGIGGFVAAEMAVMAQERLARLVLVGAAGLPPREGEILDQILLDFPEYVAAGFRDKETYDDAYGDHWRDYRELWHHSREMTCRVSWKPYMYDRRLPALLSEVEVPALVVTGSEDRVVPLDCAQQYASGLRNARLEVFQGAGHIVEMEEPARLAELIAAG